MTDLLKTQQCGVDIESFGEKFVSQSRRDVVRVGIASEDHQNLLTAVVLQYSTKLHPFFVGGIWRVRDSARNRPQRSLFALYDLCCAFHTLLLLQKSCISMTLRKKEVS